MDFRLLGPVEVEADGRGVTPRRPRERAVLALLLLRHPGSIGVEELIDAVWGENPPRTARTALQGLISAIRHTLGAHRIETATAGYRLRLQPGDQLDLERFEALVADASAAPPAARAELLREALALFRGEPLGDVDVATDLHPEIARLESRRQAAEEAQLAAELDLGRHLDAIPRLERIVAEHPLREGPRGQLMLALYRAGRQADALRVAQDARSVLATELGIDPGPALQRLERQVLEQDPELDVPAGAGRPAVPELHDTLATFLALVVSPSADRESWVGVAGAHGGVEVPARRGTAFAFSRARDAAVAAAALQRWAQRSSIDARIGLHSGVLAREAASDQAVHLAHAAHPGQVVLSRATRDLIREASLNELDVRDLGTHRLADLRPGRPLYQLVAAGVNADLPPVRGLDGLPTNLPVQATPLIDRAAELDALSALLGDPAARLVTLTGPGGTGKTRLALHAAAELLEDGADGAWFVPLEALSDPGLVASTIAATLGVADDGGSPLEAAIRQLQGRRSLLVLDNFEHLRGAAELVQALAEATTDVTILVTSRVPLKVPLERVLQVPPLPVPPAPAESAAGTAPLELSELLALGSVALFADRAAAVQPGFLVTHDDATAVAELCRALDGLPLAIELAASRIDLLSPAAVLERLDRPLRVPGSRGGARSERHQALSATIEWSHDLLEPDPQRLFAGLATFAGGWTLEAAEAVCGDAGDVVGDLAGLVDHSLVRISGSDAAPRFGMLETIREHAAGKLDASGRRRELEGRHAAFFLALAEAAEPHLRGNPGPWLARLGADHDNLRAALDRVARGDAAHEGNAAAPATEARMAGSLWRFWYLAGHLQEGLERLEHALAAYPEPTPIRLKTLLGASVMAVNLGRLEIAHPRAGEALALAERLADPWSAAYARFMLGNAARTAEDDVGARRNFEASLRAFRELGDEHSALLVSRGLALTLEDLGERQAAAALHQDNLRRSRAAGNGRLEASSLGALATLAFDEGRIVDASLLLRESLRLHRDLADRLDTALDLARAARLLAMGERVSEAATIVGSLKGVRAQIGVRSEHVAALAEEARSGLLRRLPSADVERLMQDGARLRLEEALELALDALD